MNKDKTKEINSFRGLFFMTEEGQIKPANVEDTEVLKKYFRYKNKGILNNNCRVTILSSKQTYSVHEDVRIIHVFESLANGEELLINGPKKIYDEYVDGILATETSITKDYPWIGLYDGATLPPPELDYGFDITTYNFSKKGKHQIQWKPGIYESNILEIIVE